MTPEPRLPLPFMSDDRLCDAIERLIDAKAVAESIWFILDIESTDDALSARANIGRRLSTAIENAINASLDDLNAIRSEWLARWVEAGAPAPSGDGERATETLPNME